MSSTQEALGLKRTSPRISATLGGPAHPVARGRGDKVGTHLIGQAANHLVWTGGSALWSPVLMHVG